MSNGMSKSTIRLVTICIFIASFMSAIEGTIVTTAMPTIIGQLHGIELMNWVFSIYLLTNAMMTPIYGKLADMIGRKLVFMVAIVLFILGSALCGMANNMMTLIIARGLQGLGAGGILPVSLTIVADLYSVEKRGKVLGLLSSAWGIASVFGPLVGGVIVDTIGWHWIFFINVPLGIFLVIMLQVFFKEERKHIKGKLDLAGSLFLMLTLLVLLLGFQLLSDQGASFLSLGLITASLFFGWLFVRTEKSALDPVIDLELFRNPDFVSVNGVAALVSGFLIGLDIYIPMWMQGVLGKSAGVGGLALAPLSVVWMIGSFLSGRLLSSRSLNGILVGGVTLTLIGSASLCLLPLHTPFAVFFIITSILGLGFGLTITTTTVGAQNSVPAQQLGVATSFYTLIRTLAQTIMIAVFGILMNLMTQHRLTAEKLTDDPDIMNKLVNPQTAKLLPTDLHEPLREILFAGLKGVFLVSGVLVLLAWALSLFLLKKRGKIRKN